MTKPMRSEAELQLPTILQNNTGTAKHVQPNGYFRQNVSMKATKHQTFIPKQMEIRHNKGAMKI